MPRKEPLYPHVPKSREPIYPRATGHSKIPKAKVGMPVKVTPTPEVTKLTKGDILIIKNPNPSHKMIKGKRVRFYKEQEGGFIIAHFVDKADVKRYSGKMFFFDKTEFQPAIPKAEVTPAPKVTYTVADMGPTTRAGKSVTRWEILTKGEPSGRWFTTKTEAEAFAKKLEVQLAETLKPEASIPKTEAGMPVSKTFVSELGYDVELPIARALEILNLGGENTISSGFHTKLYGGKWMIILREVTGYLHAPSQAVFTAAKKAGMNIIVRNGDVQRFYDIILPDVAKDEIDRATEAFDSFGKEYARIKKLNWEEQFASELTRR